MNKLDKKIPELKDLKDYRNNNFIESSLVEIPNNKGLIISLEYKKIGFKNALDKMLIRKEVLDRLILAKKYLPENITFKIWDSYRTLALQKELYDYYKDKLIKDYNLKDLCTEEQNKVISKFVSIPNYDIENPPLHTTGGAIDLTLIFTDTLEELDMGTHFDNFTDKAKTNYYEESNNLKVRNNRRILYNAMINAGFTNLPSEWWHYDYGNRAWAYYKNYKTRYKGIFNLDK